MAMSEATKKKLLALGVPEDRHDAASLVSLFPPEFKMGQSSLSAADIGNVFITFVEHGLVSAPGGHMAIPIGERAHVCHFYRSREEHLETSVGYVADGLRAGERCLWVPPAWLPLERARKAVRAARKGLDDAEATGRLLLYTDDKVHFDERGVMRDEDAIIRFWLSHEEEALSSGFRRLRICGDGTAMVAGDAWRAGVAYEHKVHLAFRGRQIVALCGYAMDEAPLDRLVKVLSGHAVGVARTSAGWKDVRPGDPLSALEKLKHG